MGGTIRWSKMKGERDSCCRSPGYICAKFLGVGCNPLLRVIAPGSNSLQTDIFSGCWNCSLFSLLWLRCINSRLLFLVWDTATFLAGPPKLAQFSSVTQSRLILCDPHGLQDTRRPCPSPTLRVYSNSCPSSQWCNPTISSSVIPFSSHLQSFPASGYFQMNQFFTSGGQSIGVSASASVLPMNIQDLFPLG